MQTIKIFLGSSLDELYNERRLLGDYIMNSVRPIFKYDDVDVELLKCEDMDLGYTGDPSQNIINDQLNDCNYFIFVFKKKAGGQTRLEYDIARAIQKAGTHQNTTIRVYILSGPDEGKEQELLDFQEQLKKDGLYWSTFNNPEDIRGKIEHHLIQFERQLLGKMKPSIIDEESTNEKEADVRFNEYMLDEKKQAQRRKEIHKDIEDLLQQTKTVMANEDETIAARIFKVIELYKKADQWAAATAYDKEKYSHLLFEYASFLYNYGLYHDAESIYLRQIEFVEELYGKEHENTAISYNSIGSVYRNQGDFRNALKYHNKALNIHEKVFGMNNENTAITYSKIGVVYWDKGDYDKAIYFHQKALDIRKNVRGEVHYETANSYNNIGLVYNKLGQYSDALAYFKKTLEIDEKLFGAEDPNIAPDYNNIAMVLENLDKDEDALKYHNKAKAIFEHIYGVKHPYTATSYNNLSHAYCKQGKYEEALWFGFKALEIWEKSLGKEHPNLASVHNILGKTLGKKGQYDKALMHLFKAMAIDESSNDKVHPDTAEDYFEIGLVYKAQGERDNALNYLYKAYLIYKKVFGVEHPKTKDVLKNINELK